MKQDLLFEQQKAELWLEKQKEAAKFRCYYQIRSRTLRRFEAELILLNELKTSLGKAVGSGDFGVDLKARVEAILATFERRMKSYDTLCKETYTRLQAIEDCENNLKT